MWGRTSHYGNRSLTKTVSATDTSPSFSRPLLRDTGPSICPVVEDPEVREKGGIVTPVLTTVRGRSFSSGSVSRSLFPTWYRLEGVGPRREGLQKELSVQPDPRRVTRRSVLPKSRGPPASNYNLTTSQTRSTKTKGRFIRLCRNTFSSSTNT